jgi:hypothetical protein
MRDFIIRSIRESIVGLVVCLAAQGCSEAPTLDLEAECDDAACAPASDGGESSGAESAESEDGGVPPAAEGGSDDGDAAPSTGLPCEVLDVLQRACGECHGDPPAFGAPMALADYADLHVPAWSDAARPVYEVVAERLVDEASPMPPGAVMEATDRQILLDWIAAGAPEEPDSNCGEGPADDEPTVGPDSLPCEPDVEFLAHGPGGLDTAFAVPEVGADDLYMCFSFHSPFPIGAQGTAWAPIIDDERVVHHIVLYSTDLPTADEGVYPCSGILTQLTHQFVAIWAPGGENFVMPQEAGLDLSAGSYVMEIHYNNSAHHQDVVDRSGMAMCTTDEPREHKAGSLTLGTYGIFLPPGVENFPAIGRCGAERTALWPEEVHVAFSAPHMHKLGRKFKTTATRLDVAGGGLVEHTLVDVPLFDFNQHKGYTQDPPFVMKRGDEVHTTCVYDNPNPYPVVFGEGTQDEMCLNFMLVYPIDTIVDRNCGVVL